MIYLCRSSQRMCSVKKGGLKTFAIFTGKHLCNFIKKRFQTQVLSCKYCKFLTNVYFEEHLQTIASIFIFEGQKQLIESTVSSKRLAHQRKHSKVQNGPGRDETCGLRFVTIKTGSRKITRMINDEMVTVTIDKIKKLRYCYECGRSIGRGFVEAAICKHS